LWRSPNQYRDAKRKAVSATSQGEQMPDCVHAFVQWLHEWQDFFGGFLGGLVGAVGAIYAVYLTLRKQRKD
jgi:hypothetical protein